MRFLILLTFFIGIEGFAEDISEPGFIVNENVNYIGTSNSKMRLRLESSKLLNVPTAKFYCEEDLKTSEKTQLLEALGELESELFPNPTLKGEFGVVPCGQNRAVVKISYSKRGIPNIWNIIEATKVLGVIATSSRCEVKTQKSY